MLPLLILGQVLRALALIAVPATVKASLVVQRLGYDLWALLGVIFLGVVLVGSLLCLGELALTFRHFLRRARPGAPGR